MVTTAQRNIPACAGKTHIHQIAGHAPKEHPRVRGESQWKPKIKSKLKGTSPRARGKPWGSQLPAIWWGNIPACAGKTQSAAGFDTIGEEHPRVRGENSALKSRSWPR